MQLRKEPTWILAVVVVSVVAGAIATPAGSSPRVVGQVPTTMLGRYLTPAADNSEALVFELRLRPARDPICRTISRAVGQPATTCFTLGKQGVPLSTDPGARGTVIVANRRLSLRMTTVPYGKECEGSVTLYRIDATQTKLARLRGTCGDKRYRRVM